MKQLAHVVALPVLEQPLGLFPRDLNLVAFGRKRPENWQAFLKKQRRKSSRSIGTIESLAVSSLKSLGFSVFDFHE